MKRRLVVSLSLLTLLAMPARSYPLDGYEYTGITRLLAYDRAREALLERGTLGPGSLRSLESVVPRLLDRPDLELPAPDPGFGRQLEKLLGADASAYGLALLDLSDPAQPVYAEHQGLMPRSPGSLGKLLVALGWFQALADTWQDDVAARERLLRETQIAADEFIRHDTHEVPIWNPGDPRVRKRPLVQGDRASLWTFLDWMLSASSNAAASTVIEHLLLFRHFGNAYWPGEAESQSYFRSTPRAELGGQLRQALVDPVRRNGLDPERWRQGSFFTQEGKARVPGAGSTATARELVRMLLRMEQGRLVDAWSSREIKRLIYMTDRRIRYASHPALSDAAVYFKSGSLYSCKPEPDFVCQKYHGNVRNYMNSVAIIESDTGGRSLHYLVAVLSNVLRRNSAVEHQTLAMRIHRLIESRHPPRPEAEAGTSGAGEGS